MNKWILNLVTIAVFGHIVVGRSWHGYDHHFPTKNYHNFDYKNWCHSAGGWGNNPDSWEDTDSAESNEWNDDKYPYTRPFSTLTTTSRNTEAENVATRAGNTPSPVEVLLCIRQCPLTSEYNPVCGTDNITYRNRGRLQCAISCGINVTLKSPSACTNDPTGTTLSPSSTTPSFQSVQLCMRSCPVTSEYNPVCGSDDITYNNPSRFECAKNCGKPITMRRPSRCPAPGEEQTSTSNSGNSNSSTPQPIPITTTTVRTTSNSRPITHTTIDVNPPVPSPVPLGQETMKPSGLNFTIPPNVLDELFSQGTTPDVPDYSVDERYGD